MVNLIPLKSLCKTTRGIYGFMNDYGTTRHVVYTVLWTTVVQNDTWYIRCYERLWYITTRGIYGVMNDCGTKTTRGIYGVMNDCGI